MTEEACKLSISTSAVSESSSGQATSLSKNQAKNDAKRAAKLAKFEAKMAKAAVQESEAASKPKAKSFKSKTEEVFVDKTPVGEKKDMSEPMASGFNPIAVEAAWYSWWEKSGFFKPEYYGPVDGSRKPFVIVMPPPNVTGSLHIGHASMLAIEDCIVRWRRMHGDAVLYLPGCDHAGIATQSVVEKKIYKDKNLTRHDLGREAFIEEVWKWKSMYGHRIGEQTKRMGASADWDRHCFTLDPQANKAVVESFIQLFNQGLIFRANRLVNWCGKLKTSLSDLEVDKMEVEGETLLSAHGHPAGKKYKFGVMTYFGYRVENSKDEIVIGTTRPETVFGDTALCVHPNDERYKKYHGKNVIHPVMDIPIPIICDEAADPTFGTGALKVSPAHDPTDFVLGQKHNLKFISAFDENNILNENCGKFAGMPRYEARDAVVEHLKQNGMYRREEPNPMSLPICSRSGDFVEPRMIPQWWLDCKDMAQKSVDAVRNGSLDISPKEHEKIWFYWLENIRDWCISRQLWWGHRIPAYRVLIDGHKMGSLENETWVAARSEEEALQLACEKFPEVAKNSITVVQDEDVLDTWYSSGLWPFSTLGWPDKTPDFENFFPNQLLETGSDILFFWVARMVMMSIALTGKLPFSHVFLHAIVRDAHGRKMSKSLGNVIDPVDVIEGIALKELQDRLDQGNLGASEVAKAKEGQRQDFPNGIPQCGTDALRFSLCSYIAEGRDINMDINRVEGYRRFCNKLWNACRFALMNLGSDYVPNANCDPLGQESLVDKWILSRLNETVRVVNETMESKNLMMTTQHLHSFWLYDLCDVYIEAIKPVCSRDNSDESARACAMHTLYTCLEAGLRLLHPMMPFVTEELYQRLPRRPADTIPSICVSPYPVHRLDFCFAGEAAQFEQMFEVIKGVRRIAGEEKIDRKASIKLCLSSSSENSTSDLIKAHEAAMSALLRSVGNLTLCDQSEISTTANTVFPVEGEISVAFEN